MKIDREEIHTMIEKAGFSCGKNTAMVDVFDRFAHALLAKWEANCEPKPTSKPAVKIDKASSSLPPPSSSGPSSSSPTPNPDSKQITLDS